jgi:hypothetical protein
MIRPSHRVVFLGPTLGWEQAQQLAAADYRSPAAMGDIVRAACGDPEAIILIDGVFEDGPSVWHKEILWALARGIAVIGASSMGALRAAELHTCGMFGYGTVFEAYKTGRIDDDDEVAVVHGPAEMGFVALTDAMVDIRNTVHQAKTDCVISEEEAAAIVAFAKARHFKLRHCSEAVRAVAQQRRDEIGTANVLAWFANRKGAKECDARNLLHNLDAVVAEARRSSLRAPPFVPTVYLRRLESFGYSHGDRLQTT